MKNTDPALLWDEDISVDTLNYPSTMNGAGKAPVTDAEMDAFVKTEEKIPPEGIKVYVHSNVQSGGAGAETWRSTTLTARREMFGAAEIGIAKNAWDNHQEEDEEEPTT